MAPPMHLSRTHVAAEDDPMARLSPGRWLVDADAQPPPEHLPDRLLDGFDPEAAMAMTLYTPRLLRPDLGAALVARLARQGCRVGDLAALALHEIVLNAAIHGNLEVSSGRATEWEDLDCREAALAAALADPVRARRVVTVALGWDAAQLAVLIIDEGRGYRPPQPDPNVLAPRRGAGRGLAIARAAAEVELRFGGRCTRLLFRRVGVQVPS